MDSMCIIDRRCVRWGYATLTAPLFAACAEISDHHITSAPLSRLGQHFEITVLATEHSDCRIRARLPEPYSAGAWIDTRNSAIHAARLAATACCAHPSVSAIEDWMAGFAAWEISFRCHDLAF